MSTDPQPFDDAFQASEAELGADGAAAPALEPAGKKKKKEKKPKAPKAKKEKVAKPKAPRSSGPWRVRLLQAFPDLYTTMLGLAVFALLVAIVLLVLEFAIPYGGQVRPRGSSASYTPSVSVVRSIA